MTNFVDKTSLCGMGEALTSVERVEGSPLTESSTILHSHFGALRYWAIENSAAGGYGIDPIEFVSSIRASDWCTSVRTKKAYQSACIGLCCISVNGGCRTRLFRQRVHQRSVRHLAVSITLLRCLGIDEAGAWSLPREKYSWDTSYDS